MAKKGRRSRKSRRSRAQAKSSAQPDTQEAPAKLSRQEVVEEDLRNEYAYVIKDLRRVAILALVMFAVLILLNVVLQ